MNDPTRCRFRAALAAGACLLAVAALAAQDRQGAVDWAEVAGPPEGEWPRPRPEVVWSDDLPSALQEARESGRPLFVTLRCLPCAQCASFDQGVLEGGAELTPLLRRFVTVRLTDAMHIDLSRLPVAGFQDLDLSWWGWFLSPQARVYGVFGGRDHVSDTSRISRAALVNVLRRVLDHHSDPRRHRWDIDGPDVDPDVAPRTPADLPGYDSWRRQTPHVTKQTCLHCHQVAEVLRQPALDAGTFDKALGTAIWPLPENVGLTLDRDDGLQVTVVAADSPADRAGVRIGDRLVAAGSRRLFGQTDLRAVLHRGADPAGEVTLRWLRDGELFAAQLRLSRGWRDTVLHWRMSISQGNIGAYPGFFPLQAKGGDTQAMAISPFFGADAQRSPAYAAGLRPHHVIVAVGGVRRRMAGREFLVWFRMRHEPGGETVLTVREGGAERELRVALPAR